MNKFETQRFLLKLGFAVAALLLPIVMPFVAPRIGIREGGRISLSGMQVVYAVLSAELALAVYLWGVGNWSRFEPPQLTPGASTTPASGQGQPPSTLPTPQGGR